MPLEQTLTITRPITTERTETVHATIRVDQFTVRTSGPDKGEIFGRTSILNGDTVIDAFDWVVPPSEVLPVVGRPANGALSLYAAISEALYSFPAVVTRP